MCGSFLTVEGIRNGDVEHGIVRVTTAGRIIPTNHLQFTAEDAFRIGKELIQRALELKGNT